MSDLFDVPTREQEDLKAPKFGDGLKTLLWVNGKRLKAKNLPLLRMPVNQRTPGLRRSKTCPVAAALPGDAVVWESGYTTDDTPFNIPAYVSRSVMKADRDLRTG